MAMLKFDGDGVMAVCARDGGGGGMEETASSNGRSSGRLKAACNCASVARDFNKTERQRTYDKDEGG